MACGKVLFAACVAAIIPGASPADAAGQDPGLERRMQIEMGKKLVRERLRDPESAQFRNVFHSTAGGGAVVCGEVNSGNAFGGKTGFTRFLTAGSARATFFEPEVRDFATIWDEMCR